MYRTSHTIRILSAPLAVVFGLGLVATAGGALREDGVLPTASMQLVKLEPVIITPQGATNMAAACAQAPKAAL